MNKLNVLLLAGGHDNLFGLKALISDNDLNIYTATSQQEAFRIFWEHGIALALIDLPLQGVNTKEIIDSLRSNRRTKNIHLLFISGEVNTLDKNQKDNNANTGFIFKPFNTETASAKVAEFLQHYRSLRQNDNESREIHNLSAMAINSADIICTINASDFTITGLNKAFENILGLQTQDYLGKPVYTFTNKGKESETYKLLNGTKLQQNEIFSFEDTYVKSNGEEISLQCRGIMKNHVIYLNLNKVSENADRYDLLVEAKEKAEKECKRKDLFLASMSHEIRTPINSTIDVLNMLKETDLDERQRELLGLAVTNSEMLLGIVNDILDLSKIEAGKLNIRKNQVNLRQFMNALANMMEIRVKKKNLRFGHEFDNKIPDLIFADSLRLNQILMNLLDNALKFTKRGIIKLSVRMLEKQETRVQLQFTVLDTGIGIAPEKLNSIFDSYTQAEEDTTEKFGGTGLGLSIVKQLVELKGGKLGVKSKPGQGTTFTFTNWYDLVLAEQTTQAQPLPRFQPFNNPNVLLVEDNELNQMALRNLVSKWSIHVDEAYNGAQAIEMLKKKDYQLILMDTQMPEMNGYEATQAIRSGAVPGKSAIPIISVSAGVSAEEQKLALKSGMNEIVAKPVKADELYDKIRTFLS